MAWYDSAVFYHIYPLGLCGCEKENTGKQEHHFDKLKEWAKYIQEMNFTAIYIGPLFESVGHGYETTDYKKVDCRLGTNEEFKDYVAYCHELGLKVIVDGVFNHVGRRFFAFQDVQEKRAQSPYCSWFCNLNFDGNNEYDDGFSYDNWGGFNLLVKLNQRNPEVQGYLFDVIRFWVSEFDIDGIRLDAADVLDFDFMKAMRRLANEVKPEFWLMGEVIHGDYSRWANDEMLHSVTNYELHKGLYSGHNDHNYFEIAHSIRRLNGICGQRRLYTFIDNHDVERIVNKLNKKEHLPLVTILLYTVYGIPSVYYGSEFGIEGKKEKGSDWSLRPCLELADYAAAREENVITKLCAYLGALKKEYRELSEGQYQELLLTNRQYAFGRVLSGTAMVTALNCDDSEAVLQIKAPVDVPKAFDLLGGAKEITYQDGYLHVTLVANSGTVIYLGQDAGKEMSAPNGIFGMKKEAGGQQESLGGQGDVRAQEDNANGQGGTDMQGTPCTTEVNPSACKVRLEGFGIVAKDIRAMADFYRNVFGFAIEYTEKEEGIPPKCISLKRDGIVFKLYGRNDFESITSQKYQFSEGLVGHYEIVLAADSPAAVDETFQKAISLGAKSVLPPSLMEWGERSCYVADPEGNIIEICCQQQ